jgi:chaperonin cofactor prefoldin
MELDAMKAKLANDKEALSTKIAEIESKQKELEEKKVTSIEGNFYPRYWWRG